MPTVEYAHITIGPDNVPMLTGTRIKVVEIVRHHLAYRWDARDICREFPQLSLGQAYSALGYYYDHQAEVDAEIDRRRKLAEETRARLGDGPLTEKLKAMGNCRERPALYGSSGAVGCHRGPSSVRHR